MTWGYPVLAFLLSCVFSDGRYQGSEAHGVSDDLMFPSTLITALECTIEWGEDSHFDRTCGTTVKSNKPCTPDCKPGYKADGVKEISCTQDGGVVSPSGTCVGTFWKDHGGGGLLWRESVVATHECGSRVFGIVLGPCVQCSMYPRR